MGTSSSTEFGAFRLVISFVQAALAAMLRKSNCVQSTGRCAQETSLRDIESLLEFSCTRDRDPDT